MNVIESGVATPREALADRRAAEPIAAHDCPLCGAANGCRVAASGEFDVPCWCTSVRIDPAVLARIPQDRVGVACLCARCAEGA